MLWNIGYLTQICIIPVIPLILIRQKLIKKFGYFQIFLEIFLKTKAFFITWASIFNVASELSRTKNYGNIPNMTLKMISFNFAHFSCLVKIYWNLWKIDFFHRRSYLTKNVTNPISYWIHCLELSLLCPLIKHTFVKRLD